MIGDPAGAELAATVERHLLEARLAPLLREGDGALGQAPDEAEVVVEWNEWDGVRQVWDPVRGVADAGEQAPPSIDARTLRRGRWKLSLYATGQSELYDLQAHPEETHIAVRDAAPRPAWPTSTRACTAGSARRRTLWRYRVRGGAAHTRPDRLPPVTSGPTWLPYLIVKGVGHPDWGKIE